MSKILEYVKDELAEKYENKRYSGCSDMDYYGVSESFKDGFDAAVSHLASAAPEFNQATAIDRALEGIYYSDDDHKLMEANPVLYDSRMAFVIGARWQFDQLKAMIAAREEKQNRTLDLHAEERQSLIKQLAEKDKEIILMGSLGDQLSKRVDEQSAEIERLAALLKESADLIKVRNGDAISSLHTKFTEQRELLEECLPYLDFLGGRRKTIKPGVENVFKKLTSHLEKGEM